MAIRRSIPNRATLPLVALALAAGLGSCSILKLGTYATESFLGEPDRELAGEALPTFIKVAETILAADPGDQGKAVSLASLWLLYGTGYLDGEAYFLEDSDYWRWLSLRDRAHSLYLRSMALLEPFVEKKSPGFFGRRYNLDPEARDPAVAAAVKPFGRKDVPLLYYTAASIFAAFSSNPLESDASERLPAALVLLGRALELDPAHGEGSVQELAFTVFMSLPPEMGGGRDRALEAYRAALEASGGLSASLHVSWATLVCAPAGDREGFIAALDRAMALDAEAAPGRALLNALARRKAARLAEQLDLYFYLEEPEESGATP